LNGQLLYELEHSVRDLRKTDLKHLRLPGLALSLCLICAYSPASSAQERVNDSSLGPAPQNLGPDTIADMVDQVSPAVVNIVCMSAASRAQILRLQRGNQDYNRKLRRHLGLEGPTEPLGNQIQTKGAGVLVRPDGYILTCLHVVQNADDMSVTLKDGRKFQAKIVGRDGFVDLAVIKIEARGLPVVKFGDADRLRAGQWVFAIGNPYGYENSVSAGLVSGLRREARKYAPAFGARTGAITFIQTDVPLNEGSSGGPLFNLQGEVVGINSFIRADEHSGSHVQNIGFATPANLVRTVADQLIQKGSAAHPYLGIEMRDPSEATEGGALVTGVEVTKVKAPSPAASAGMQVGDLIVEIDATPVCTPNQVSRVVATHAIGEHITVKVKRAGADKTLSVKVENLPEEFD
jgi:serine protease Do